MRHLKFCSAIILAIGCDNVQKDYRAERPPEVYDNQPKSAWVMTPHGRVSRADYEALKAAQARRPDEKPKKPAAPAVVRDSVDGQTGANWGGKR